MATAVDITQLLAECQDTVDHVTLEEFEAFPPNELVLLELPKPWREGRRYRCFARASLLDYAATAANCMSVEEEGGIARVVTSTYLPGLDLEHRDLEFLARSLELPPADSPVILHVARIVEVPAPRVLGSHGAAAHIHELAEAQWERQLWSLFDRAVMPGTTTCPSGHPLRQQPRPQRSGHAAFRGVGVVVICDNCERTLVGMERYRCTRNCDFDLCQDCFGRGAAPDEANRSARLGQQLEAFWREREGFALPRSAPRLDARSKKLSPAVTKWNMFTLKAQEDVLRLREQFLADLRMHGVDTSSLRLEFWPGCAVQCERVERYARLKLSGSLTSKLSDQALRKHACGLAADLGPAWSEDLAMELLTRVMLGKRSMLADERGASVRGTVWRYWAELRLAGPLLQVIFRAPWWHLTAVAAGVFLCAFLSPA